jgi:ParB family chromosome partitioning protein
LRLDRTTQTIPVALIDEPQHQLRDGIDPEQLTELADSMAAEGLHQPIGVRQLPASGRYEVVWGHRRLLAARLLHWDEIEAKVFDFAYDPTLAAISENLQRSDLTPLEEANAVQRMLTRGQSRASVARLFRRSAAWVDSRLALLELPDDLRTAVHARRLTLGVADALAHVDHADYRAELINEAERAGATVQTVNVWVAHYEQDKARLLHNRATVREFVEARSKYVVYYPCDVCHQPTDYQNTRGLRLCGDCGDGLARALAESRQEPTQRPTSDTSPASTKPHNTK